MFNVACELSLPMGKKQFSSTAKNRTNSVSLVRKAYTNLMLQLCTVDSRYLEIEGTL